METEQLFASFEVLGPIPSRSVTLAYELSYLISCNFWIFEDMSHVEFWNLYTFVIFKGLVHQ